MQTQNFILNNLQKNYDWSVKFGSLKKIATNGVPFVAIFILYLSEIYAFITVATIAPICAGDSTTWMPQAAMMRIFASAVSS
jgi:hypothetical protein